MSDKLIIAKESTCNNGGCTKERYRGKYCFRCWAGVKWTSIIQRVENKNGNNNCYENIHIGFTKEQLIQWVLDNPPPRNMKKPSIDRIDNEIGYTLKNIQWLEHSQNARRHQKHLPNYCYQCPKCQRVLTLSSKNFYKNKANSNGFQTYCKPCKKEYDRLWKMKQN